MHVFGPCGIFSCDIIFTFCFIGMLLDWYLVSIISIIVVHAQSGGSECGCLDFGCMLLHGKLVSLSFHPRMYTIISHCGRRCGLCNYALCTGGENVLFLVDEEVSSLEDFLFGW